MLSELQEYFAGCETPAYLVGGYLRDSLLSQPPGRDIDVAVAGDSQALGRQLSKMLGGKFVPLSPTFGTARVVAPDPEGGTWTVDLSAFAGSIEEDLARRDFTINALALPLAHWGSGALGEELIDPFQGRKDLAEKCIRAVSRHAFQDDPCRLLRSVRLASALGFRLEPETARQVLADASHLGAVAVERVRDEFLSILALDGAKGSLEALDRLDLLCRIIPELAEAKGVDQPKMHYWDVWGHLLHAVENAERITKGHQHSPVFTLIYWTAETAAYFNREAGDLHSRRTMLKLAALLHDIAKPRTKHVEEDGRTRFPGHFEDGAKMAEERLAHLRCGSKGIGIVSNMVKHHLRPSHMMQGVAEVPTARAIHRYFRDLGDVAVDTLYLSLADYLAAKGPELHPDDWAIRARMTGHMIHAGFQAEDAMANLRLVNGNELIEQFHLNPGPVIGRLLERIEEAQGAGEISTREEALALAADSLGHQRDFSPHQEQDGP